MDIIAADIGGTHARFALAEIDAGRVVALRRETVLSTAAHAGLASAWAAFVDGLGQAPPRAAGFALACHVDGDELAFTNNPWVIRVSELPAALGLDAMVLVNDFAAVAHAVEALAPADFRHICGPEGPLPSAGVISVIGPGTGLGVGALHRLPTGAVVTPTEGGHIGFAPCDALEDQILARARARFGRVSAERVISGPGLALIAESLAAQAQRPAPHGDDAALWRAALEGSDPLAAEALARFCAALGGFAGDIALAQGAAGVVIAGGIGLRLADRLADTGFAERFVAKGRFSGLVASLPVKLITHPQPGLLGAAAAFAAGLGERG